MPYSGQSRIPLAARREFSEIRTNKTVGPAFSQPRVLPLGDTTLFQRWRSLIAGAGRSTPVDSFIEAQLDYVSFTARSLLPLIGAETLVHGENPRPKARPERQRQRRAYPAAGWSGEDERTPAPNRFDLFAAWVTRSARTLIQDELAHVHRNIDHVDPLFIERVSAMWTVPLPGALSCNPRERDCPDNGASRAGRCAGLDR